MALFCMLAIFIVWFQGPLYVPEAEVAIVLGLATADDEYNSYRSLNTGKMSAIRLISCSQETKSHCGTLISSLTDRGNTFL